MPTEEQPSNASPRIFQRVDWVSFGLTTLIALIVYWFSLASEVGLQDSGHFVTSSTYLGVPDNPGFPVWTIYSWLFTKLPFSNIAWRMALSSAVAGAFSCGVVALTVSRVGTFLVESFPSFKNLSAKDGTFVRLVCGCVAGLGFGFDGCVWPQAVIVDPRPLSLFLFALTLCFLKQWFFAPQHRRCLYAAALTYGLAVCNSQSLLVAAPGLVFLVTLADRNLGREIFFGLGILLCAVLEANYFQHWFDRYIQPSTQDWAFGINILGVFMWIILSFLTRRFFSEWKTTITCAALFLLGASAYFLLPIFSMMNPPMNWGYPRTVEGFFHVITRGQYESPHFTDNIGALIMQLNIYGKMALAEFGWPYLMAAIILFCLLHKIGSPTRKWLVGLLLVWLSVTFLLLVGLNMSADKSCVDLSKPFFAASHLVLAVLSGCGLMLVVAIFGRPSLPKSRS